MSVDLVIVGASRAGLYAAEGARRAGHRGRITLVGAEPHLPYDRPPLSKEVLSADDANPAVPYYRSLEALRSTLDVEVLTGARATSLDVSSHRVWVDDNAIEFGSLVIATGATARQLRATAGLNGVLTLRTMDDAWRLRAAFEERPTTVIIGAGLIGSEVAAAAIRRGLDVTIVETQPVPMWRVVGEQSGKVCAQLHERHGSRLLTGVSVSDITSSGGTKEVVLSDGTKLPAELIVVGVGATPETDWLADSGLTLDDGLVCDGTLNAGVPGIYGAGDVVRWPNGGSADRTVRLETWTSAAEQGRIAGRNAVLPGDAVPFETVPYVWSDQYGSRLQFVGDASVAEEIVTVHDSEPDESYLALYHGAGLVTGAFGLNQPRLMPKLRRMIARGTRFDEAVRQLDGLGIALTQAF